MKASWPTRFMQDKRKRWPTYLTHLETAVSAESNQQHPLKPHAVGDRRRCSLNSMRKADLGKWSQARPISPNEVNHPKCELMGRGRTAQVRRGIEGERREASVGNSFFPAPLHWWWAGRSGCAELTLESCTFSEAKDDNLTAESRINKASGECAAVRAIHSTQRTGEPATWGRGSRSGAIEGVRVRR